MSTLEIHKMSLLKEHIISTTDEPIHLETKDGFLFDFHPDGRINIAFGPHRTNIDLNSSSVKIRELSTEIIYRK